MAEQTISTAGRGPIALTTISAGVTAAVVIWAQSGPGFGWDGAAADWIRDSIPYLTEMAAAVTWPLGKQWPFAAAVLAAVLFLTLVRHQKGAVFLLGAVAGGLLMDWTLRGLLTSLGPETTTLLYASALGGLALGLTGHVGKKATIALWTVAGLVVVTACLASVAAGGLVSAAVMSTLLAASWLMILRHLAS